MNPAFRSPATGRLRMHHKKTPWGANESGQLGVAPSTSQPKPVRVANLDSLCGVAVIFTEGSRSRLPDGSFKLGFRSDLNRSYLIQYSSDMRTWKTAFPPVNGTGGLIEWIDNGPPTTDRAPGDEANRFYRVIFGL